MECKLHLNKAVNKTKRRKDGHKEERLSRRGDLYIGLRQRGVLAGEGAKIGGRVCAKILR